MSEPVAPAPVLKCLTANFRKAMIEEDPTLVDEETVEEGQSLADDLEVLAMTDSSAIREPSAIQKRVRVEQGALEETLRKATEQVVVEHTLDEYRRLWNKFAEFCVETAFAGVADMDAFEALVNSKDLPGTLPMQISLWIMQKCDEIDIYTNEMKPLSESRKTYAYAQKMRAAISHKFGRELRHGVQGWQENAMKEGSFSGNPSLAYEVSQYMISLRRRKARAGEVVQSARAITEDTIRRLYDFNTTFEDGDHARSSESATQRRKRKAQHPEQWGSRDIRLMLNTIYVLSFLCLLRFDEILRLQWHWLEFEDDAKTGKERLRITIPFRKTHQTGGIAPFVLYENHEKPWLDPVLAVSRWMECKKNMKLEGFVFRKKVTSGRFSQMPNQAMSAVSFLECFRNNMTDIGVDPRMYGTHSFRRGGCQYLATDLRWPIRKICNWGGWSENQDTGTIFKYLLSWTDETVEREDFFNSDKQMGEPCSSCGRTCPCA